MEITFVTGNDVKFGAASLIAATFGVTIVQKKLEIDEIQSDSGEVIARHKAADAYALLQQPLVISDDTWLVPGLNNWPGPYMKDMNKWLRPEDFLHLTASLEDRRIIMRQILVYQDGASQKVFTADMTGSLLTEAVGTSIYPSFTVVSFDGGKHSAAELGYAAITNQHTAWHELIPYLKTR